MPPAARRSRAAIASPIEISRWRPLVLVARDRAGASASASALWWAISLPTSDGDSPSAIQLLSGPVRAMRP